MAPRLAERRPLSAAVLLLAVAAWLTACDAAADDPPMREVRLDGEPRRLLVAPQDGNGMRGRAGFDGADGMLFDPGREVVPGSVVFVMDGVTAPLDVAWFDRDGRFVESTTMPVCPAAPCPHHAPARAWRWAIEAPAGTLAGLTDEALLEVPD